MPENRAAGNEKLPMNFGRAFSPAADFCLASPHGLRNNFRVKNKILLLIAAIGLLFTGGCISIG